MELLKPAWEPNPDPTLNPLVEISTPEEAFPGGEKVYVAVGKSVEKALSLLQWSFKQFCGREICLLHILVPSPVIPTLLGKLPASQANTELLTAFRIGEREQTKKLLEYYLSVCAKTQVKASVLMNEAEQVQKGVVEMVDRYHIMKLVMGATLGNWMKVKKRSAKANYANKHAPAFCEIWFVNKRKHLWTREAFDNSNSLASISQVSDANREILRSRSLRLNRTSLSFGLENFRSRSARTIVCDGITSWLECEQVDERIPSSASAFLQRTSPDSDSMIDEDCLHNQLKEARKNTEVTRNKTLSDLLECRKLESEVIQAVNKAKAFEAAHVREVKQRKEAEDALRATLHEQEELLKEKEEVTKKLRKTMRSVALLDGSAKVTHHRCEEASAELKLIQTSIATLGLEKQRIRRQKLEALRWLERWRTHRKVGDGNYNEFNGFFEEMPALAEFSLTELKTATCDFSESFKIGEGGNGCIYKGEMMGRTVSIKTLHSHNVQGQLEFQQEVHVLSKLQHPHLVTLIGFCPEAWSLVYEYLPNGSLQDQLFQKKNASSLHWKIRVRIIADIASALCFLHSSKPEKIVHGHLKPENILLDSELRCKICDFGICRLVTEETLHSSKLYRNAEPKSVLPYTDPEFHRFGVLTPKSDVFAFGQIILQLITGKPPVGLVRDVRKAVTFGKLSSVLDSSAGEWPMLVARCLADIALQCSEIYSRDRPDITPSLVSELEHLYESEERPIPSFFLCPIRQEVMHDPQVAADGFTYEGEALRAWLAKGHETSPMTNLKLTHLHLTPNHALRLAIQDWFCKS